MVKKFIIIFILTTLVVGSIGTLSNLTREHPQPLFKNDFQELIQPPEFLTISIINTRNRPILTSHALNLGAPTPILGGGVGTIAGCATADFTVPTGWAGNVAIGDALALSNSSNQGSQANSLIEGSFVVPEGYSLAVADIDVSYV